MSDNTPVYGCDGCNTTGGRASCPIHRGDGTGWLGDSFREIERLQGLLAAQDREYNAENLRAERAEARVKELEETAGLAHCPYCHRNVCGDRCTDHDDECPARAAAKGGEDE